MLKKIWAVLTRSNSPEQLERELAEERRLAQQERVRQQKLAELEKKAVVAPEAEEETIDVSGIEEKDEEKDGDGVAA